MKVTILGTGCIWTKRSVASYLVNEDIMVDVGFGSLKQLFKSCDTLLHHEKIQKIKLILITHFHADHYFDIVHIMEKLASDKRPHEGKITIICPPNGKEKVKALCDLAMSESTAKKINLDKYVDFVYASDIKKYKYNDLTITPVKLDHGDIEDYGYIISDGNKSVGFTGDTCMCKNLIKMLDKTNVAFVDMAGTDISEKHFNIIDGIELMKKYEGKCNIVPAHLTSQAIDYCVGKINPPCDLQVLDLSNDFPYNSAIKKEKAEKEKAFKFEKNKFARICGKMVDLVLTHTKTIDNKPSYCYDVVLPNTTNIIGRVVYTVFGNDKNIHKPNVFMTFEKDYNLMSVKYEICTLIRKVAEHHGETKLLLTCSPNDYSTRKVYVTLDAVLKEITTSAVQKGKNKRDLQEDCIWVWEFKNGK